MAGRRGEAVSAFTATGQPIKGRRYTLTQGELVIPVTVVGKAYGRGGFSDLVAVILEEETGGREMFPWPIEADDGADPISFTPGWSE